MALFKKVIVDTMLPMRKNMDIILPKGKFCVYYFSICVDTIVLL